MISQEFFILPNIAREGLTQKDQDKNAAFTKLMKAGMTKQWSSMKDSKTLAQENSIFSKTQIYFQFCFSHIF